MKFSELDLLLQFPFQSKGQAVLVDVGAHAGFVSVKFAQRGWRVISFEPEPENRKDLQERLKSYKDVTIIPKAVSNKEGELVPFYVSSEHWGIHSLKPFHPTHKPTLTVETVRLDKTLNSLGVNHVSLLKIDVEGADFSVLQGFDFDKIQPEIAMCEFADDRSLPNFGCTHHDIAHYMESKGYKVFVSEWAPIKDYGRKGQKSDPHEFLQCVPYPLNHEPAWGNLIFVPNDNISVFEKVLDDYLISCKKDHEPRLNTDSYSNQAESKKLTISVITPSFNQSQFLRDCLDSVAQQTVTPLEHLVYDPGSKDDSHSIIREYAKKYSFIKFFDEPDCGQSDAVSKGMMIAQGDIIGWLNSDDCYATKEVFEKVITRFQQPDYPDIVYGNGYYINENGKYLRDIYVNSNPQSLPLRLQSECGISQPALFFRRSIIEKIGLLAQELHFCMDYEYWIRAVKYGLKFVHIPENLSIARYHITNKTYGQRGNSFYEVCTMLKKHYGYVSSPWLKRFAEYRTQGFDGVLANSSNQAVTNLDRLELDFKQLLAAFNGDFDTWLKIKDSPEGSPAYKTLVEMKNLEIFPFQHCQLLTSENDHVSYSTKRRVGERIWSFDLAWKAFQLFKFRNYFDGRAAENHQKVCVIVGNGPSLNKSNLELLHNCDVIISNNAFLKKKLLNCSTYYTVVNYLVAEQSSDSINMLEGVKKIVPYWLSYCIQDTESTFFVHADGKPEFSTDIFTNISWRHTVTFFNLQLAYGLGYRKVLMIGFDHAYKQPENVKEGDIIISDDDPNHFDNRYFARKRWQAADVVKMEEMYNLAKLAYEADNREILNCTVGGSLDLFPRSTLEKELINCHSYPKKDIVVK